MSEELLINFAPTETRVALIENGVLQEVYIERTKSKGFVGYIFKGKVVRVQCGLDMQQQQQQIASPAASLHPAAPAATAASNR